MENDMARGIRKDTPFRIQAARDKDPLALGPYLGELCTGFNITASMIATIVGSHDQTVLRWFFGQSSIAPQWSSAVSKLVCVLDWMHANNAQPLKGDIDAKTAEFSGHVTEFRKLMNGA
jgi:hypothetical protein